MDGEQGVDMPGVVAEVDVPTVDEPATVTAAGGIKNSRVWSWYTAVLMSLCYGVGELSHFLVGTTSRAMSQDLHYGDLSCQRNDSALEVGDISNITCSHYLDEDT
jgi:secreted protein with Ig-like and vWFA domain